MLKSNGLVVGVLLAIAALTATLYAEPHIGKITGTTNTSVTKMKHDRYNATVGKWGVDDLLGGEGYGEEPFGDDVLTVPIRVPRGEDGAGAV